jgi:ABC-type transport system involved in multi-copper enzyme maturation permease subunit
MNTLRRLPAVFLFEWRRALTFPRMAWMLVLMLFPPLLLALIRSAARSDPPPEVASVLVFALSPCVACMMSVFLWATPAISSELEGRSWVYITVRPYGPSAILLGKYLVAVSWSLPVGFVSATLGVLALGVSDPVQPIVAQCALAALSCVSYSALFLLIGVLAPKRSMVMGVLYAVIFEGALASVPAAVNLLTVQYRLRCLLVRWMELDKLLDRSADVFGAYFGNESASWHAFVLLMMTVGYLAAAAFVLRHREFTAALETDA